MDFESLPVGTEKLLNALGYELTPSRGAWLPSREYDFVPAECGEPDRLGAAAAAQMSKIVPEKKLIPERDLNCGLWPEGESDE